MYLRYRFYTRHSVQISYRVSNNRHSVQIYYRISYIRHSVQLFYRVSKNINIAYRSLKEFPILDTAYRSLIGSPMLDEECKSVIDAPMLDTAYRSLIDSPSWETACRSPMLKTQFTLDISQSLQYFMTQCTDQISLIESPILQTQRTHYISLIDSPILQTQRTYLLQSLQYYRHRVQISYRVSNTIKTADTLDISPIHRRTVVTPLRRMNARRIRGCMDRSSGRGNGILIYIYICINI